MLSGSGASGTPNIGDQIGHVVLIDVAIVVKVRFDAARDGITCDQRDERRYIVLVHVAVRVHVAIATVHAVEHDRDDDIIYAPIDAAWLGTTSPLPPCHWRRRALTASPVRP